MADVQALLKNILSAIYGKDVRQSIHDAIKQCYYDGKAGGNDLEARDRAAAAEARMDTFVALPKGSSIDDSELQDIRNGIDGFRYGSAGQAVREQIRNTHVIEVSANKPTRDNTQMWINPTDISSVTIPVIENGVTKNKEMNYTSIHVKNLDGEWEAIPAIKGESVYDIVRVYGNYEGSIEQYANELLSDGWIGACDALDKKIDELDAKKYSNDAILSNNTKADFGLENTATPDNAFAFLSKYNQHWWSVLHGLPSVGYKEHREPSKDLSSDGRFKIAIMDVSVDRTISYSRNITIDQSTGKVSLLNPEEITLPAPQYSDPNIYTCFEYMRGLAGCYITNLYADPERIYLLPNEVTTSRSTNPNGLICADIHINPSTNKFDWCNEMYMTSGGAWEITSEQFAIASGDITYVHSSDPDAYGEGIVGDSEYHYLGVPFDNFQNICKCQTGSYIGTGNYGTMESRKTINLQFKPSMVILWCTADELPTPYFAFYGKLKGFTENTNTRWVGDEFYWWADTAARQFNEERKTYHYIVIG